ncbi:MAG: hypothetical protein ACKVXR_16210 [Planctomycetota bacterium]
MTRLALTSGLCALTVSIALATAVLQSQNRSRGLALDSLKEECDMLEAANSEGCERILALDHGPLPLQTVPESQSALRPAKGPVAP